ncbi:MAG: LysR family transcriptional regulator [Peptoniphilaceae bacterium]
MNIFELECFLTLARYLNFTKAAEHMFITQPVFSRHITRMEEELDTRLFFRDKRSVSLTPSGMAFLPYAQQMVETFYAGKETLQNEKKGIIGTLHIGVLKELHNDRLTKLVSEFIRTYPKLQLHIREYSNYDILPALLGYQVGIIFTISTGNFDPALLQWITEQTLEQTLVLPSDHPMAEKSSLRLSDVHRENFVFLESESYLPINTILMRLFEECSITPRIVGHASSIQGLMSMVECGMGISIVPGHFQSLYPNKLAFVPLTIEEPAVNRVIAWRKDNDNLALKLFLRLLQ